MPTPDKPAQAEPSKPAQGLATGQGAEPAPSDVPTGEPPTKVATAEPGAQTPDEDEPQKEPGVKPGEEPAATAGEPLAKEPPTVATAPKGDGDGDRAGGGSTAGAEPPAPAPRPTLPKKMMLFFPTAQHVLGSHLEGKLDRLAKKLKEVPGTKVRVFGHADRRGESSFNFLLSKKRAQTVAEYLIGRGVPESDIEYKGMGDKHPLSQGETPEALARNRRAVILISQGD